jgi:hypothetical protein
MAPSHAPLMRSIPPTRAAPERCIAPTREALERCILPAVIERWLSALLPAEENEFAAHSFQDIFYPITFAALILLIVTVVLYNVQTRKLHRHPPLVAMWEWILWTAVIVYGLVLVEAIFHFWFVTVVATLVIGLGTFVWIRFVHFPPIIAAYDRQLRRARYLAQERASTRYADASSTIRTRRQRRRRR